MLLGGRLIAALIVDYRWHAALGPGPLSVWRARVTELTALRATLALAVGLPGIALTGFGMEEDVERSREAGFLRHLTKPVHLETLEAAIRQVTE